MPIAGFWVAGPDRRRRPHGRPVRAASRYPPRWSRSAGCSTASSGRYAAPARGRTRAARRRLRGAPALGDERASDRRRKGGRPLIDDRHDRVPDHRPARHDRLVLPLRRDAAERRCHDWLACHASWIASFGDITRFMGARVRRDRRARVFRFFGEALRQAGILIIGSTIVIWGTAFILGLQCGIEGAYFSRSVGAPARPACLPRGATCARSSRTRSAT